MDLDLDLDSDGSLLLLSTESVRVLFLGPGLIRKFSAVESLKILGTSLKLKYESFGLN